MGFLFREQNHIQTASMLLNPRKCEACWKCLDACPQKVLGRINLPWHKHAVVRYGERCIGCRKCERICPASAFIFIKSN